jgi:hypothetical protein
MPLTTYYINQINLYALQGQNVSIGPWYAGLWTASPTATGDLFTECAGTGYARLPVTWATDSSNANELSWLANDSNWGVITHFVLCNALTGNYVLAYQSTSSYAMTNPTRLKVQVGKLKFVAA